MRRCGNCKYWCEVKVEGKPLPVKYGACRRRPPRSDKDASVLVGEKYWCGEWRWGLVFRWLFGGEKEEQ